MRKLLVAALVLVLAACGQPERTSVSGDRTLGAGERSQAPDTVSHSQDPQEAQRPEYGLGAPWPAAVLDEARSFIANQVDVVFRDGLTAEQELALVDSIAVSIKSAASQTKLSAFTFYAFRWPGDARIDRDSLILLLKSLPVVEDAFAEAVTRIPPD